MLVELSVSSFAIIESLRLEFGPGFNVLTGETGTGKSILIDAVSLILGARASTDLVRAGSERAVVEGVFRLSPRVLARLKAVLEAFGLYEDSGDLVLCREVAREGRSVCRANGRAVTLGTLREIGGHLVDIHGQGDHLSLLRVRNHVDFVDRYAGLLERREAFADLVRQLGRVRAQLVALRRDERELARRLDLLGYQIEEIRTAALEPGAEEDLKCERALLANVERRLQLSAEVHGLLTEGQAGERSLLDLLGAAAASMSALAGLDDSLAEPSRLAETTLYQLEDLARSVREYRDGVEYDPKRLGAVEDRLDQIFRLKRKYGDSIEEILAFAEEAEEELGNLSQGEARVEQLVSAEEKLLAEIAVSGQALSQSRKEAAERLCAGMEAELADLNMEQARFWVDVRWVEAEDGVEVEGKRYGFDSTGLDRVEFLISPNPGEDLMPLARIASGGETSRLMLAMKRVLSAADPVPTLIFDEIDSGIGGRTGSIVGRKLWGLSRDHQVLCATHLAQMACYGDLHFRLDKNVVGGRTVSSARRLSHPERVEELAVLLGGAVTPATRRSAAELIKRVGQENAVGPGER